MSVIWDVLATLALIYLACFALSFAWLVALICKACVWRRDVKSLHWFIVIKYTIGDYVGKRVDAHYVSDSNEAMLRVAQGPMRPGEKLRGFWVQSEAERLQAIELHDERMLADRDWLILVDRIESQWERVGSRVTR